MAYDIIKTSDRGRLATFFIRSDGGTAINGVTIINASTLNGSLGETNAERLRIKHVSCQNAGVDGTSPVGGANACIFLAFESLTAANQMALILPKGHTDISTGLTIDHVDDGNIGTFGGDIALSTGIKGDELIAFTMTITVEKYRGYSGVRPKAYLADYPGE